MSLHGTQRSLRVGVVREGFWEEAMLIQSCLCYGWGIHTGPPAHCVPCHTTRQL